MGEFQFGFEPGNPEANQRWSALENIKSQAAWADNGHLPQADLVARARHVQELATIAGLGIADIRAISPAMAILLTEGAERAEAYIAASLAGQKRTEQDTRP